MTTNSRFIMRLTGEILINKVIDLADLSKADIVNACGYSSVTKSGKQILNYTEFYTSLLLAKGDV